MIMLTRPGGERGKTRLGRRRGECGRKAVSVLAESDDTPTGGLKRPTWQQDKVPCVFAQSYMETRWHARSVVACKAVYHDDSKRRHSVG
jgi:hypothetical protein